MSPAAAPCSSGYVCIGGVKTACPGGSYSTGGAVQCTLCPNGTASGTAAASSVDACLACPVYPGALIQEGSAAGAADCWPGVLTAVAFNPAPVVVGFSVNDIVVFRFTKPTTAPPAPVLFSPPLGTLAMGWINLNTQLLVRVVDAGGPINPIPPASVEIGILNFSMQVKTLRS